MHRSRATADLNRRWAANARSLCSGLVALALLFQAFLPLVHQPPKAVGETGDIPGWILASLCLGSTSVDGSQTGPVDDQAPASKCPVCPICLAAHYAGTLFAAPQIASLILPTVISRVDFVVSASSAPARVVIRRPPSRGPPVLA